MSWFHLNPIPGHPMEADFDCAGVDFAAKFALAADVDGDGRAEIVVAPDTPGTAGNDFWVMDFDPATGSWGPLGRIPGHPMEADFDCAGVDFAAKFALAADVDGDGRAEIVVAPDTPGTAGNDFWVMRASGIRVFVVGSVTKVRPTEQWPDD